MAHSEMKVWDTSSGKEPWAEELTEGKESIEWVMEEGRYKCQPELHDQWTLLIKNELALPLQSCITLGISMTLLLPLFGD